MTNAVVTPVSRAAEDTTESVTLTLHVTDPNVLRFLHEFDDEEARNERALEALKVGVIAILSASPSLDTEVVEAKFADLEGRLAEHVARFEKEVTENLQQYFKESDGIVPRSIDGFLGESGILTQTIQTYFDPTEGQVCRLMQTQIGPESTFGKALDPRNKDGILSKIESRVQELVELKLDEVLKEFSLDQDGSAMCRLHKLVSDNFTQLSSALAGKAAAEAEALRGHVKGINFEDDLYAVFAAIGRQLGDQTELVRGKPGKLGRSKKGDFVATLGQDSGAPNLRLVLELKDSPYNLKEAVDELAEAKENREAACGIFVFSKGFEPREIGDFRRIGEDFYCTVDKEALKEGRPLIFFDSAVRIARAMSVASARKEKAGEADLQRILDHINSLLSWVDKIGEMVTKASTVQKGGKAIEEAATLLKKDLDDRLKEVLSLLQR